MSIKAGNEHPEEWLDTMSVNGPPTRPRGQVMTLGTHWQGPGDLVIHCQHCERYPFDAPPRPDYRTPGSHPSCLLIRHGELIPGMCQGRML